MKRIDLKNETAYVYSSSGEPVEVPEGAQEMVSMIGEITNEPVKALNTIFSKVLDREVQGVYIAFDSNSKIMWITACADNTRIAADAVENALVRLREAQKKEES